MCDYARCAVKAGRGGVLRRGTSRLDRGGLGDMVMGLCSASPFRLQLRSFLGCFPPLTDQPFWPEHPKSYPRCSSGMPSRVCTVIMLVSMHVDEAADVSAGCGMQLHQHTVHVLASYTVRGKRCAHSV
ncbi:hypothetical protein LZ31DRAFT_137558 [Colletotrichum somersetense]|nr:hypothetical protein LZ31DRAFT_137558 [Colletotrichum somersetense]